jgi:hypothetical protein
MSSVHAVIAKIRLRFVFIRTPCISHFEIAIAKCGMNRVLKSIVCELVQVHGGSPCLREVFHYK